MVYSHLLVLTKRSAGQSILFAIESNPGPGIGILLAYMIFGKGTATSYGAGIIHFFGGIHEIYFPYVLMRPLLFIVILGGMTGVATYQATGFGFKSPLHQVHSSCIV